MVFVKEAKMFVSKRPNHVFGCSQSHSAVFFSYIDPETKLMDTGFTEHSGCPVFSGEKKIVTQWIRLGVDEENPWDAFNTLGIKYKDIEALEMQIVEGESSEDGEDEDEYYDDDEEETNDEL